MEIMEHAQPPLPVRLAGRVIVLDPAGRVLLFRYDDPPPFGVHWATPGGGLEPGEDYHAGAVRELREETGWDDVQVGPEVLAGWRTLLYEKRTMRQHERIFLARVDVERRELGEVATMHASDGIAGARWWTLEEVDSSSDVIYPDGLADVLRDVTARSGPGLAG